MAVNFPNSPSNNDTHTENGLTWKWDGTTWIIQSVAPPGPPGGSGPPGAGGPPGPPGPTGSPGSAVPGTTKVAILKDQKDATGPSGVNGGDFINGGWRDRDLTVEEDPQNFVTFNAGGSESSTSTGNTPGYWSLAAGTYKIDWSAPAFGVKNHQSRLIWDTTESTISNAGDNGGSYEEGSSEYCRSSQGDATFSIGSKILTITDTTYFKILHKCITTSSGTEGFGVNANVGIKNIYTQVKITDLSTAVAASPGPTGPPGPPGSGGGASVTTSDTPPTSPNDGDLWWDSEEGVLNVYYEDANTSQWVNASGRGNVDLSAITSSIPNLLFQAKNWNEPL